MNQPNTSAMAAAQAAAAPIVKKKTVKKTVKPVPGQKSY